MSFSIEDVLLSFDDAKVRQFSLPAMKSHKKHQKMGFLLT